MTSTVREAGRGMGGERFRSDELAWQLRRLAEMAASGRLPLHVDGVPPVIEFRVGSAADVDQLANHIGRTPDQFGVEYSVTLESAELRARWVAEPKPLVDPEPIAEHYKASGWKGEAPGTCGIQCACGVAYDGFDTLAEAKELLDRHIADPTGQLYTRVDDGDVPESTISAREVLAVAPVSPGRAPLHYGVVDSGHGNDCHGCGTPPGGQHATACGVRPWAQR